MTGISRTPAYNLKAVLKETGLKADVLRAWERRYELPQPQRTPGGHRLYSEYDIGIVKWLRARQAEGLNISRAVDLWKELLDAGRDPLAENSRPAAPAVPGWLPAADLRIEVLRREWLEACLAFDEIKADEAVSQAFAIYPVETVCTQIFQQGLSLIGENWYLGKVSVQQEHFASALAIRRLETLIAATPHPTREQSVLVGSPPGEWHSFSILLLSLLLRRSGLKVVYLGANLSIERLEETAAAIQPNLVVLAAQQLTTAAAIQAAAIVLQHQGYLMAYGGLIFNRIPRLRERIPAHFLGESLGEAVAQIDRLASNPIPLSKAISVENPYQDLARLYREKRPQIDIAVSEELKKTGVVSEYGDEAITYFGNGLAAALELGDPAFLEPDLEWVRSLLAGHRVPAERLAPFLADYSQVIRNTLGHPGAPLADWIDTCRARNAAELSR